jgi:hypothetical protein
MAHETGSDYDPPFEDDVGSIPDDAILYRRVPPGPTFVGWDPGTTGAGGSPRVRGGAFQDYSTEAAARLGLPGPCMSVAVASILEAYGNQPSEIIKEYSSTYGVVALRAGELRDLNHGVQLDPNDQEGPWHAVVFCKDRPKRKSKGQSSIARRAEWVIIPDPPPR